MLPEIDTAGLEWPKTGRCRAIIPSASKEKKMRMKVLVAGLCISVAPVASALAFAQTTTQTETRYVTVDGDVVRYEPGKLIVVRGADNKEATYVLSPDAVMPAEVTVGRRVTLFTQPGPDGSNQVVSRVTTTSVTPEGNVKRTTEDTRVLPSGATEKTTTTNISGKVAAYESGKTLTITRSDGTKATYLITDKTKVPADLVIGKTVTVLPLATNDPGEPVAGTVTYTTTKTITTVPKP